jgi:hypothetical protein
VGAEPEAYDLFVAVAGFREVATRIHIGGAAPTVVDVTLQIASCPQCLTIGGPPDPTIVLTLGNVPVRANDLKSIRRETFSFEGHSYSGFSLAELLMQSRKDALPSYGLVSAGTGYIVFPLSRLLAPDSTDKILIADALEGRRRVFLIEDGKVTESLQGVVGVRLVEPR